MKTLQGDCGPGNCKMFRLVSAALLLCVVCVEEVVPFQLVSLHVDTWWVWSAIGWWPAELGAAGLVFLFALTVPESGLLSPFANRRYLSLDVMAEQNYTYLTCCTGLLGGLHFS